MFDKVRRGLMIPDNKPQEICFTELFRALQTGYYKKILSGLTQTIALQENTTLPNYLVQITFPHTNTSVTLWLLCQHTCGDKAIHWWFLHLSYTILYPEYSSGTCCIILISHTTLLGFFLLNDKC